MGLFLSLVTQACQSLAENHPLYRVSITMGWFWVAEESVGVVWILIWDSIKVRQITSESHQMLFSCKAAELTGLPARVGNC